MCNPLPSSKTCCQCKETRPASSFLPSAGGVNRRQRANLTPSAPERISTHG